VLYPLSYGGGRCRKSGREADPTRASPPFKSLANLRRPGTATSSGLLEASGGDGVTLTEEADLESACPQAADFNPRAISLV
jgi:hypothetical protein